MKKLLALILTALMLVSLLACDSTPSGIDDDGDNTVKNDHTGDNTDNGGTNTDDSNLNTDTQICSTHDYVDNICSVCGCSLWNGETDTSWYSVVETEFNIATAEQLAGLSELVYSGVDFANTVIILNTDIDLNDIDWLPIGTSLEKPFSGIFDGNGHTVYNVKLSAGDDIGFFGYSVGNIEKIYVNNITIHCNMSEQVSVGGLIGWNDGNVSDCHVNVNIDLQNGGGNIGGLIGHNNGNCERSSANGTIKIDVMQNYGTYEDTFLGGLIGNHSDGTIKQGCFNGKLMCNATREDENLNCEVVVGGFVGQATASGDEYIVIENNYCEAEISAKTSNVDFIVGGFAGCLDNNNYLMVKNSYAISTINAEAALPDDHSWMSPDAHAAGLVGCVRGWDDINISNCWVDSNIILKTQNVTGYTGFVSYDCSDIEFSNIFYASNVIEADEMLNTAGTPANFNDFKNLAFYVNRMKWDTEIWNLVDGEYPTLK
ncbi:MAG: hypothetical protein IJW92_01625 [Clostridia bacterium]|nr:hypothetical protein [Clostridia bacterium]